MKFNRFYIVNIKSLAVVVVVVLLVVLSTSYTPELKPTDRPNATASDYRSYTYGMNEDLTSSYSHLLSLYREGHKSSYICASLKQCGNSLYLNGYYARALEAYTMALEMAEETGEKKAVAGCLYCIGNIHVIFKDYERAIYYYKKVLYSKELSPRLETKGLAARYLVMCCSRIGDIRQAQRYLKEAKTLPLSDSNIDSYYNYYCGALIESAEGNNRKALSMFDEAYRITDRFGMKIGMGAYPLGESARILARQGKIAQAISKQKKAFCVARRDKAFDQLDEACVALDSLYSIIGQKDSALHYLNVHRELSTDMLNSSAFYTARNKLMNYEEGEKVREIGLLEKRVNLLTMGIVVFLVALLVMLIYGRKLRSAYKMLVIKNRQLIDEQDENRKLLAENKAARVAGNDIRVRTVSECHSELISRIMDIMSDSSLVFDKDFSLQKLAQLTGSNTKYVSSAISSAGYGSFKILLNDCRIKEACKRLVDEGYSAYTIQAVAESVGYVSVNNFIVQFKRYTGMTPSVYKKNADSSN